VTRQEFMYEIKNLTKKHGITIDQLLLTYSYLYGINWSKFSKSDDVLVLYNKGILTAGNKVNTTKLFGKKESGQLQLNMESESEPKGTEETLKLAENLKATFGVDADFTEDNLKEVAQTYFKGDVTIAYYFMIYKGLFPKSTKNQDNAKWNSYFGFRFDDMSKWTTTVAMANKFAKIYKTEDIGLFLSGTFYYVKDTIDYERGKCYAVRADRFLDMYKEWIKVAEDKFNLAQKKKQNN